MPETDEMLTMLPAPWSRMIGATAAMPKMTPYWLISVTSRIVASSQSSRPTLPVHASVVDEPVDAAMLRADPFQHGTPLRRRCHVEAAIRAAHLVGDRRARLVQDVGHDDVGTFGRGLPCLGGPHAASSTGDDDDLVCEAPHHYSNSGRSASRSRSSIAATARSTMCVIHARPRSLEGSSVPAITTTIVHM